MAPRAGWVGPAVGVGRRDADGPGLDPGRADTVEVGSGVALGSGDDPRVGVAPRAGWVGPAVGVGRGDPDGPGLDPGRADTVEVGFGVGTGDDGPVRGVRAGV